VMNKPRGVEGSQTLRSLCKQLDLLSGSRRASFADKLEAHSVDELHDQEVFAPVGRAILKGADNMGMNQVKGHLPLKRPSFPAGRRGGGGLFLLSRLYL